MKSQVTDKGAVSYSVSETCQFSNHRNFNGMQQLVVAPEPDEAFFNYWSSVILELASNLANCKFLVKRLIDIMK